MPRLAENLKRLREAHPLTQEALGALTGLKQTAISRYEKGKTLPDLRSAMKLAAGLRVSLETLVEGEDVRFDAIYKDLRVSITTGDNEEEPIETPVVGPPPTNPSLEQIVPGYDASQSVTPDDPPENLAPAATVLDRIMADLLTLRGRIVSGSDSVDDRRRPGSGEGPVRRGVGGRGKTRPKKTPKRPNNRKAR